MPHRKQWKPNLREHHSLRAGLDTGSALGKRRHGLNRCRYKGASGMKRWTGFGVLAGNLINIGKAIDKQQKSAT
jgi:IS5 family transposase